MSEVTLDFQKIAPERTLFAGRKNGERARSFLKNIPKSDFEQLIVKLHAEPEQVITSSYFLGLFGKLIKRYPNASVAKQHIDFSGLSERSKEECMRAVERGFISVNSLL